MFKYAHLIYTCKTDIDAATGYAKSILAEVPLVAGNNVRII